jgi:hypothetical protein
VLYDKELRRAARSALDVYCWLDDRCHHDKARPWLDRVVRDKVGRTPTTIGQGAHDLGLTYKGIRDALAALAARGYIATTEAQAAHSWALITPLAATTASRVAGEQGRRTPRRTEQAAKPKKAARDRNRRPVVGFAQLPGMEQP